MPDIRKQQYYRENRERRLEYQREYYKRTREHRLHDQELLEAFEPESCNMKRKKMRDYNRKYYLKNKARIAERRKARYRKSCIDKQYTEG